LNPVTKGGTISLCTSNTGATVSRAGGVGAPTLIESPGTGLTADAVATGGTAVAETLGVCIGELAVAIPGPALIVALLCVTRTKVGVVEEAVARPGVAVIVGLFVVVITGATEEAEAVATAFTRTGCLRWKKARASAGGTFTVISVILLAPLILS